VACAILKAVASRYLLPIPWVNRLHVRVSGEVASSGRGYSADDDSTRGSSTAEFGLSRSVACGRADRFRLLDYTKCLRGKGRSHSSIGAWSP
jgi:hypothetical protein